MTLKQPLFMQAGKYTAAADRYLIGAMLYPKGGEDQNPRPGIRPYATVGTTDNTMERSFRVDRPVGTNYTVGDVVVDEGAAFVAGPVSQTLNGIYLVVNDGPSTVNLTGSGSGARIVELYVQILDAEIGATPPLDPTTASATFAIRDTSNPEAAVPMNALLIATISLDAGGSVGTITDKRVYTTMHGGTAIVSGETELQTVPMSTLPLGSTAYSLSDMATYTRTLNGWETVAVLHVAKDRPQDAKVPSGYLFFDTDTGTEEIFIRSISGTTTTSSWYTMGRADGKVRLMTSGAYPPGNFRHAQLGSPSWTGKLASRTTSNFSTYVALSDLPGVAYNTPTAPTYQPPTREAMAVRFMVLGDKTIVTAVLSFEINVRKTDYNYEELYYAEAVLDLQKYTTPGGDLPWSAHGPVTTTNNAIDYNLTAKPDPWKKAGMRASHRQDAMKSRTVIYQLNQGEYFIEPRISLTGPDAAEKYIQVVNLTVDVVL